MRVNNTFRKIIDCFLRKHCRDSLCQMFWCFSKVYMRFFFLLTRSLIYRCQIVTDTCKNNVSKFVWKPFKSPLSLRKWKSYLFYLPFTRSKIVHFMEDLAVFTALNHSGSFEKNFVKFKKNVYDIYRLRCGPYYEKLWHRSWKFSRPRSQFFTISVLE